MNYADIAIRQRLAGWLLSAPVRERLSKATLAENLDPADFYTLAYAIGVLDTLGEPDED